MDKEFPDIFRTFLADTVIIPEGYSCKIVGKPNGVLELTAVREIPWVSVEDALPLPDTGRYLVVRKWGGYSAPYVDWSKGIMLDKWDGGPLGFGYQQYTWYDDEWVNIWGVTHWVRLDQIPLPE